MYKELGLLGVNSLGSACKQAFYQAVREAATSLQGLANRQGPKLFLNFGVYDTTRSGF